MVFYGMVFVCYAIHILVHFPVAAGHATLNAVSGGWINAL